MDGNLSQEVSELPHKLPISFWFDEFDCKRVAERSQFEQPTRQTTRGGPLMLGPRLAQAASLPLPVTGSEAESES
jgi:hypothetical protein